MNSIQRRISLAALFILFVAVALSSGPADRTRVCWAAPPPQQEDSDAEDEAGDEPQCWTTSGTKCGEDKEGPTLQCGPSSSCPKYVKWTDGWQTKCASAEAEGAGFERCVPNVPCRYHYREYECRQERCEIVDRYTSETKTRKAGGDPCPVRAVDS